MSVSQTIISRYNTTMESLERGITTILPTKEGLQSLLNSDKTLNIYLGIDPTATRIHLGHAVALRKLQSFVEMGHNVTFLIGDFTALIGDTSDKDTERPVLTSEEIQQNFATYKEQASKIIDFTQVSVKFNSEWLSTLRFSEIVKLCQHFSVGDFVGRELIKNRLQEGKKVGLHETLYPVMQGYDSYYMDTDVQIGGSDQTFNMLAGRTLQKDLRNKETFVVCVEYLLGTDGRKMSKSWGNAIWLTDEPHDMYGKVMSLKDELIESYLVLATSLPLDEVRALVKQLEEGANPMDIKKKLAWQIVKELYDETEASKAEMHFTQSFQESAPDFSQVVEVEEGATLLQAVSSLVGSNSEAKRLIVANAVDVNGEVVTDSKRAVMRDDKIKVGKRTFATIKIK